MAQLKFKDSNGVWQDAPYFSGVEEHNHGNLTFDGKLGSISDLFVGTGSNGAIEAKTVEQLKALLKPILLEMEHPIGSYYFSDDPTSPAQLFGGTWSALPTGKFLRTGTGGDTGGSDTHVHTTATVALTIAQLPSHTHGMRLRYNATFWNQGAGVQSTSSDGEAATWTSSDSTGSGAKHGHGNTGSSSNVPAYYGVYAWRRTA